MNAEDVMREMEKLREECKTKEDRMKNDHDYELYQQRSEYEKQLRSVKEKLEYQLYLSEKAPAEAKRMRQELKEEKFRLGHLENQLKEMMTDVQQKLSRKEAELMSHIEREARLEDVIDRIKNRFDSELGKRDAKHREEVELLRTAVEEIATKYTPDRLERQAATIEVLRETQEELLKQAEIRRKRVDEIRAEYEEEWKNDAEERTDRFQEIIEGKNGQIRELLERIESLEHYMQREEFPPILADFGTQTFLGKRLSSGSGDALEAKPSQDSSRSTKDVASAAHVDGDDDDNVEHDHPHARVHGHVQEMSPLKFTGRDGKKEVAVSSSDNDVGDAGMSGTKGRLMFDTDEESQLSASDTCGEGENTQEGSAMSETEKPEAPRRGHHLPKPVPQVPLARPKSGSVDDPLPGKKSRRSSHGLDMSDISSDFLLSPETTDADVDSGVDTASASSSSSHSHSLGDASGSTRLHHHGREHRDEHPSEDGKKEKYSSMLTHYLDSLSRRK
eukprot:TRINITY_DN1524_c1_g1_i4.p1 TRINITY_DN1524_c1_g1~~TRINITY_DN1524_c1_g1_i4.p1  ORF type:complete len:504 (+),score=181.29 TRINITY_DN1524_c1_g1_i4:43-1554(+)